MFRFFNNSTCSGGKSSPTTPTSRTGVKKLAEYEKKVAEPPRIRSRIAVGVSTESIATEPTTKSDICRAFRVRERIRTGSHYRPAGVSCKEWR